MKRAHYPYCLLAFLLVCVCNIGHSQEVQDSIRYSMELRDGNEFIGYKLNETAENITLRTEQYGDLTLVKREIKSITAIKNEQLVNGVYYFENPQATRYLWAPNGYGLKKGEGYYQNVWIFFNQVAVGINEHISLGGGIIPLFFFDGAPTPVWVTPKFSLPIVRDKFNVGGGALVGTVLGAETNAGFGIVYGQATLGSKDANASLGAGWGYSGDGLAKIPTFTLSGMLRVGPKGYLVSENYFVNLENEGFTLLSLAGRSIINKISLDYGLFFPVVYGQDEFIAIPWLGLVAPFGNKTFYK